MNDKSSKHSKIVEKYISIKTIDGSIIRGKINVGPKRRISDVFLAGENPFVVLYNVDDQINQNKVLIINKQHIVWVEPEDILIDKDSDK